MKTTHTLYPDTGIAWRLGQFVLGTVILSIGIVLMIQARLGLGPWDVLHQGISLHTGMPIGTASILAGLPILLLWLPLGERPGIGTALNIILVGVFIDGFVELLPPLSPHLLPAHLLFLAQLIQTLIGVTLLGAGSAVYITAGLGPGPRDGVMMGLVRRTGRSIRLVRTLLELTALLLGWLLGGTVGIGTLAFAFGVGPVIQTTLRLLQRWQQHPQEMLS